VQRDAAAGDWMVGPPSSWSLRDQEDSSCQARWRAGPSSFVYPRTATCPREDEVYTCRGLRRFSLPRFSLPRLAAAISLSAG
jgi:hypothetical protein